MTPHEEWRELVEAAVMAGDRRSLAGSHIDVQVHWEHLDISAFSDVDQQMLDQRYLVVRIPREGKRRTVQRTIEPREAS